MVISLARRRTQNAGRLGSVIARTLYHRTAQGRIVKQRRLPKCLRSKVTESNLWISTLDHEIESSESSTPDHEIWRDSESFIGTTRFEPCPEIRNIMVTGGSGFIGSWVVRHLVCTYPEYRIVNFDKLDYCSSMNNTAVLDLYPNYNFYHGDITCSSDVGYCLRRYSIDTVLHFAAKSHVDNSFADPQGFVYNNVCGTNVMLDCSRSHGVRRFIHVSTDEVYGEVDQERDGVSEDSPMEPTNPYAASKAAAEMLVKSYIRSFRFPAITVRGNNVFGPHQYPEKIIPKFSCLASRGETLSLHGDGSNMRRYLYASDAVDAFDVVLHRGKIGEVYNIASHYEISNNEVAEKILSLSKIPGQVRYTKDRPFNDSRYAVDGSKLEKLGWKQQVTFEDGLQRTVRWYEKFGEVWWAGNDGLQGNRKGGQGLIMSPSPTPSKEDTDDKSARQ